MTNSRFENNLEKGRRSEQEFLKRLTDAGKIASMYYYKGDKNHSQVIEVIEGIFYTCPDIEVYEKNGEIILRIEVKSFGDMYKDEFVTISESQFKEYLGLLRFEEIEIKVVFHILRFDEWFWKSLMELDKEKGTATYLYQFEEPKRKHYKWHYSLLETNFDWIKG